MVEGNFDPSTLRIQKPRRQRWASHDSDEITHATKRVHRKMDEFNAIAGSTEKRVKVFLQIMEIICAQPALIAQYPPMRNVVIHKVDEFNAIVQSMESEHEEEFVEMTYAFGDLLSELHDHPLYKEE
jgi:hypothetical protein